MFYKFESEIIFITLMHRSIVWKYLTLRNQEENFRWRTSFSIFTGFKMDYAASTMFDSLKNNRISKLALSKFLSQSLWVKYTIAIQQHEIGLTLEIMRVTASIVTLCIQLIAFIAGAICGFRARVSFMFTWPMTRWFLTRFRFQP